ncbi:ferritin-like domain-containing protein [Micromonospora chokoriensis]|uniref:ferritin-like domain-containing protein n=1 Tax=Micromonospora chokoriensis TaxID=356851 RepID=UPI0012FCC023|nr:ferritin-like domain-containing protein [Micromonospora chokoriensis]
MIRAGMMGRAEEAFVESAEGVADSLEKAPEFVRLMARMMTQFAATFQYVIITVVAITALLLFELILALKLLWINPALLMEWLAKAPAIRAGFFQLFVQLVKHAGLTAAFNILYELLVDVTAQLVNRGKGYQRGWDHKSTGDAVKSGGLESLVGMGFSGGKGLVRQAGIGPKSGAKGAPPPSQGGKAAIAGAGLAGNAGEELATEVIVGLAMTGTVDTGILAPTVVSSALQGMTFGGIGAARDALSGGGKDAVTSGGKKDDTTAPPVDHPDPIADTDPVPGQSAAGATTRPVDGVAPPPVTSVALADSPSGHAEGGPRQVPQSSLAGPGVPSVGSGATTAVLPGGDGLPGSPGVVSPSGLSLWPDGPAAGTGALSTVGGPPTVSGTWGLGSGSVTGPTLSPADPQSSPQVSHGLTGTPSSLMPTPGLGAGPAPLSGTPGAYAVSGDVLDSRLGPVVAEASPATNPTSAASSPPAVSSPTSPAAVSTTVSGSDPRIETGEPVMTSPPVQFGTVSEVVTIEDSAVRSGPAAAQVLGGGGARLPRARRGAAHEVTEVMPPGGDRLTDLVAVPLRPEILPDVRDLLPHAETLPAVGPEELAVAVEPPTPPRPAVEPVLREWLAIADWHRSAAYFADHHAELHTPEATAMLDHIRADEPDNRRADILAALIDPEFAGGGAIGYDYLTGRPNGLPGLFRVLKERPSLLPPVTRLVEASAAAGAERDYHAVLLRAADLVVAGHPEQAQALVVGIRRTVSGGQRVLWVDRYRTLGKALPEHSKEFDDLRMEIINCGDTRTPVT